MCYKILFILSMFAVAFVYLDPMLKNANNYGRFIFSIDDFTNCKGPKSKNLAEVSTSLDRVLYIGTINFFFWTDVKLDELKLQVYTIKENKRTFLWNQKLADPCKHYPFAVMIHQYLKASNCLIKKGNYTFDLNFGEIMASFLGDTFFYGTYSYRSDMGSKKGNIACFNTTFTIKKKI